MQKITLKDFLKILGTNEFIKIILGTSLIYSGVNHERFNIKKLVYYEISDSMYSAIQREKFLKGKKRKYKNDLINLKNPTWQDLYSTIIE